ncbi:MAG TPA: hypothetical protein VGQ83_10260 [Polyangia bacterium]
MRRGRWLSLLVALVLPACGSWDLIEHGLPDAGVDRAATDAAGDADAAWDAAADAVSDAADAGPDAAADAGADATADAAADAATDAGPDAATDAGPDASGQQDAAPTIHWTQASPGPATHIFSAIAGNAPDNVYAVVDPWIYRYNGTAWARVYTAPTGRYFASVWVAPTGEVFAAGDAVAASCPGSCTGQAAFTADGMSAVAPFTSVCGLDAATVYAVGTDSYNAGHLFQRGAGGTWTEIGSGTGTDLNTACYVAPFGAHPVFITAHTTMLRYEAGGLALEAPDFAAAGLANGYDELAQSFNAVWGHGPNVWAAGNGRRIIARDAAGNWSFVLNPSDPPTQFGAIYRAGAAGADGEGYAGGDAYTTPEPTAVSLARLGPAGWAYASPNPFAPNVKVWGMWAAGSGEYFIVGSSSLDGIIYHGRTY